MGGRKPQVSEICVELRWSVVRWQVMVLVGRLGECHRSDSIWCRNENPDQNAQDLPSDVAQTQITLVCQLHA